MTVTPPFSSVIFVNSPPCLNGLRVHFYPSCFFPFLVAFPFESALHGVCKQNNIPGFYSSIYYTNEFLSSFGILFQSKCSCGWLVVSYLCTFR